MMTLRDKICKIYTDLTFLDFGPDGTIVLQNDGDSKGDYIKSWTHPTHPQPSAEQLGSVQ